MGLYPDVIIRRMHDILSSLSSLRVAYVYGLFLSRDDFHDFDCALLIDGGTGEEYFLKFAATVGEILKEVLGFNHEYDVRVRNDDPVWFRFVVISTGMPLYVRDEDDRIDFETNVLVEYQDIKFLYDLFDSEYLAQAWYAESRTTADI